MNNEIEQEDYIFKAEGDLIYFVGHMKILAQPFLALYPGDKITQVGLSRIKGSPGMANLNKVAKFHPYITYVGTRQETLWPKGGLMLMFKVRDEDYPETVSQQDDFYISFEVIGLSTGEIELKVWNHDCNALRVYKPHFLKYVNHEVKSRF